VMFLIDAGVGSVASAHHSAGFASYEADQSIEISGEPSSSSPGRNPHCYPGTYSNVKEGRFSKGPDV